MSNYHLSIDEISNMSIARQRIICGWELKSKPLVFKTKDEYMKWKKNR